MLTNHGGVYSIPCSREKVARLPAMKVARSRDKKQLANNSLRKIAGLLLCIGSIDWTDLKAEQEKVQVQALTSVRKGQRL